MLGSDWYLLDFGRVPFSYGWLTFSTYSMILHQQKLEIRSLQVKFLFSSAGVMFFVLTVRNMHIVTKTTDN